MSRLFADPSIDEDYCSLHGFSTGAYAITELVCATRAQWRPRAFILEDVYGHGQANAEGLNLIRLPRLPLIEQKWHAYLHRLSSHAGATSGIFAVHNGDGHGSPLSSAVELFKVLGRRQRSLGLPDVKLDVVNVCEIKTSRPKCVNRCHESALYQSMLLNTVLPKRLRSRTVDPLPAPIGQIGVGSSNDKPPQRPAALDANQSVTQRIPSPALPPPRRKRSRTPERARSVRECLAIVRSLFSRQQVTSSAPPPAPRNRSRTPRRM